MGTGAITEYVDVAQIALYAFWILFFILVGVSAPRRQA